MAFSLYCNWENQSDHSFLDFPTLSRTFSPRFSLLDKQVPRGRRPLNQQKPGELSAFVLRSVLFPNQTASLLVYLHLTSQLSLHEPYSIGSTSTVRSVQLVTEPWLKELEQNWVCVWMLDSRLAGGLGLNECVNWRAKLRLDETGEWKGLVLRMVESKTCGSV